VSGNLATDSFWLTPPSEPIMDAHVGSNPSTRAKRNHRTILSSNRKLRRPTQNLDVSTEGDNAVVTSNGGVASPVLFGCVTDERGQIYRQKADGILGLADEPLSFPNQLAGYGATSATFTLCYGSNSGVQSASSVLHCMLNVVCQCASQPISCVPW
jgi:Xylanase inhibitor N-terminal